MLSTREYFSEVRREESRRFVMMGQISHSIANKNYALNAKATENSLLNVTTIEVVTISSKNQLINHNESWKRRPRFSATFVKSQGTLEKHTGNFMANQ